jgi:hypothetical protein
VENVAVAEKLSAIRTESFFRARARRANISEAIEILKRMGEENSPMKGDELPDSERLYALGGNLGERRKPARAGRTRPVLKRAVVVTKGVSRSDEVGLPGNLIQIGQAAKPLIERIVEVISLLEFEHRQRFVVWDDSEPGNPAYTGLQDEIFTPSVYLGEFKPACRPATSIFYGLRVESNPVVEGCQSRYARDQDP